MTARQTFAATIRLEGETATGTSNPHTKARRVEKAMGPLRQGPRPLSARAMAG